jgi:DNA-binding PadR family transcriptional regulator
VTTGRVPTSHRPIGFWLKLLDRSLDDGLGAVLAGAGLTRRQWQVCNVLHNRSVSVAEVDEAIRPFLDDQEPSSAPVLDQLVADGWADRDGVRYELTPAGVARFDRVFDQVGEFRRSAVDGITDDEYDVAIRVLERMAGNLGWSRPNGRSKGQPVARPV